jgi:hypothetical protein
MTPAGGNGLDTAKNCPAAGVMAKEARGGNKESGSWKEANAQLATHRMQIRTKERTTQDAFKIFNHSSTCFSPYGGRESTAASLEPMLTDSAESAATPATNTSASNIAPPGDSDEAHLQSDKEEEFFFFKDTRAVLAGAIGGRGGPGRQQGEWQLEGSERTYGDGKRR